MMYYSSFNLFFTIGNMPKQTVSNRASNHVKMRLGTDICSGIGKAGLVSSRQAEYVNEGDFITVKV